MRGRISPNRIHIYFKGKETKRQARSDNKSDQMAFLKSLGECASGMDKIDLTLFFGILDARPSGWTGKQPNYQNTMTSHRAWSIPSIEAKRLRHE